MLAKENKEKKGGRKEGRHEESKTNMGEYRKQGRAKEEGERKI
jgi:hypothetical protein